MSTDQIAAEAAREIELGGWDIISTKAIIKAAIEKATIGIWDKALAQLGQESSAAQASENENIRLRGERMQQLVSENVALRNQLRAAQASERPCPICGKPESECDRKVTPP